MKFVDRTFNVSRRHSEMILEYIRDHDNGITNFHFEVAGDLLSSREMEILAGLRPGQVQLEIGVQSVNPDTLRAVNRVTDWEHLKNAAQTIIRQRNIHVHLDLIAGLPCEGYDSCANSFNQVYALHPDQLQLGFLKVLKGSPMEAAADEYGILYRQKAPYEVLSTSWMTYDDLIRLKKVEAMVEMYYNSRQFTGTIRVLEQLFQNPFQMYESLAAYYESHGFFQNSPSRIYRYQVLLQFARERNPEYEDLFRELLTYDLYLREHLKSRPDFAPSQADDKEQIRNFHLDKKLHIEGFHYPVWKERVKEILQYREQRFFLAFDYDNRDPLDHNAAVMQLSEYGKCHT